ncbi:hypothetical protein FRC12_008350, partial [Ceratobasidium sp. 428]
GPRTPSRIDPKNPLWPAHHGYYKYSFAHTTMGVCLPTILGKAIDDVWRTLNEECEESRIVDLLEYIERMDVLITDPSENHNICVSSAYTNNTCSDSLDVHTIYKYYLPISVVV